MTPTLAPRRGSVCESADLEDEGLVAELAQCDLGVGHVAGIFVAQPSAVGDHPVGQTIQPKAPAGDVHLVRTLIAHVAVAPFPLPVPVVVELAAASAAAFARAGPKIVIDLRRHLVLALGADGSAAACSTALAPASLRRSSRTGRN